MPVFPRYLPPEVEEEKPVVDREGLLSRALGGAIGAGEAAELQAAKWRAYKSRPDIAAKWERMDEDFKAKHGTHAITPGMWHRLAAGVSIDAPVPLHRKALGMGTAAAVDIAPWALTAPIGGIGGVALRGLGALAGTSASRFAAPYVDPDFADFPLGADLALGALGAVGTPMAMRLGRKALEKYLGRGATKVAASAPTPKVIPEATPVPERKLLPPGRGRRVHKARPVREAWNPEEMGAKGKGPEATGKQTIWTTDAAGQELPPTARVKYSDIASGRKYFYKDDRGVHLVKFLKMMSDDPYEEFAKIRFQSGQTQEVPWRNLRKEIPEVKDLVPLPGRYSDVPPTADKWAWADYEIITDAPPGQKLLPPASLPPGRTGPKLLPPGRKLLPPGSKPKGGSGGAPLPPGFYRWLTSYAKTLSTPEARRLQIMEELLNSPENRIGLTMDDITAGLFREKWARQGVIPPIGHTAKPSRLARRGAEQLELDFSKKIEPVKPSTKKLPTKKAGKEMEEGRRVKEEIRKKPVLVEKEKGVKAKKPPVKKTPEEISSARHKEEKVLREWFNEKERELLLLMLRSKPGDDFVDFKRAFIALRKEMAQPKDWGLFGQIKSPMQRFQDLQDAVRAEANAISREIRAKGNTASMKERSRAVEFESLWGWLNAGAPE